MIFNLVQCIQVIIVTEGMVWNDWIASCTIAAFVVASSAEISNTPPGATCGPQGQYLWPGMLHQIIRISVIYLVHMCSKVLGNRMNTFVINERRAVYK